MNLADKAAVLGSETARVSEESAPVTSFAYGAFCRMEDGRFVPTFLFAAHRAARSNPDLSIRLIEEARRA